MRLAVIVFGSSDDAGFGAQAAKVHIPSAKLMIAMRIADSFKRTDKADESVRAQEAAVAPQKNFGVLSIESTGEIRTDLESV